MALCPQTRARALSYAAPTTWMWLLLDENTPDPMDDASFRVALLDRLLRDRPAASRNAVDSDTCCNRTEAGN
eukprot:5337517-Prorocentrum_lima.AAC.1